MRQTVIIMAKVSRKMTPLSGDVLENGHLAPTHFLALHGLNLQSRASEEAVELEQAVSVKGHYCLYTESTNAY